VFLGAVAVTATAPTGCSASSSTTTRSPAKSPRTTAAEPSATPAHRTSPPAAGAAPGDSASHGAESHSDLLHGPRTRDAVALTFHGAGDPALTRSALQHARTAQSHLTVLAVGSWLAQNPSLAQQILAGGHELGNHTWSHLTMTRLSALSARDEVARAAALLTRLTGSSGRWFRPSGTPRSTPVIRRAAAAAGYQRCLAYDVDPLDYTDPGSSVVAARVLGSARPGSIISLHLGHSGTVAALPEILTGLHQRGLAAVTVSHLVAGTA